MRIAVIGTGNVGSALGRRWADAGHEIIFGSRDPASDKVQALLRSIGHNARVVSAGEAMAGADVIVLATAWSAVQPTLAAGGDLTGKIIIDATNPFLPGLILAVGHTTSAGEQVAAWALGARVVKAFNSTGAGNMADPVYAGVQPTMFICGDDASAKATVADLTGQIGFEPVDAGPLSLARVLEPLAALWVNLAYSQGMGPNIAFKLLQR
jgi:8-hydroxy-5-deazaflavin:NADPH oxidoreductase